MNMNIKRHGLRLLATLVFAALSASPLTYAAEGDVVEPLMIQEQGSFAVGGTVIQSPGTFDTANPASGGQTLHGDHARVFYQVPVNARKLPLVMWHGFGQFSKTWETTADGREGYQTLFLRRQFATYLIDQPRRGAAGRGMPHPARSARGTRHPDQPCRCRPAVRREWSSPRSARHAAARGGRSAAPRPSRDWRR